MYNKLVPVVIVERIEKQNVLKIYCVITFMLKVITSPCGLFRYSALFQKKIYYFGHPEISTFVDGNSLLVRDKYIQLCLENEEKNKQIHQLIPSNTLFEYYILWGHSRNIEVNTDHLNAMLCKKYKNIDYFY
jgi:hypothetical protein